MSRATELTRKGQLQEATRAIQQALRGGGGKTFDPGNAPPWPAEVPASRTPHPHVSVRHDPLVLDGLTRVIETPVEPPQASSTERGSEAPTADPLEAPSVETPTTAAPTASASSSQGAQPERWTAGSFTHQRRTLAYKLYLPPIAAGAEVAPRPLVVMLHGCTQHAEDFAAGTRMNALARDLGIVVLYPEQTQHANAQKCWNWFKPQHQQRGRGEPAVLAALTQSIIAEHRIDPARVYVAGLSAGGAMADVLGRCYPDVFAAVGVHSGLPTGSASDVMTALSVMRSGGTAAASGAARGPVPPTIVFHGDADATVHVSNGTAIVEAARTAAMEATGRMPSSHTASGDSGKGRRYTRTVHADEAGRSAAEYWQLHEAGHAWSGGSANGSYTDPSGADASAEMLRFFLAHPRRGGAGGA
ncbi:MAG: PHB depolymerase family esterase [Gammaproteobacteria bacterium]|nr:PHB depolymerase family esterase [Gammaproteobacteria bacterium]MBU1444160.1 PHB depolymerase family esterase [Gammaproteobacteria bacterium]MBU2288133.1 PHB depolymerase family esterase [Gammaproteobacteria bacterium]MBU2407168.1 PHB depolymerase family esterase [Gammaproteobacteria bacterium]